MAKGRKPKKKRGKGQCQWPGGCTAPAKFGTYALKEGKKVWMIVCPKHEEEAVLERRVRFGE